MKYDVVCKLELGEKEVDLLRNIVNLFDKLTQELEELNIGLECDSKNDLLLERASSIMSIIYDRLEK